MSIAMRGRAFSLIELILVMVIVAAVSTIAIPRFAGSSARYRADAAAERVAADLRLARSHARQGSAAATVLFDVGADRLRIPGAGSLDGNAPDYTTPLRDEPYRAGIDAASFAGNPFVTYDGFGNVSSGGSVQISVGQEQRQVVVDPVSGEVQVQ